MRGGQYRGGRREKSKHCYLFVLLFDKRRNVLKQREEKDETGVAKVRERKSVKAARKEEEKERPLTNHKHMPLHTSKGRPAIVAGSLYT